jgi:hypothetical protein
MSARRATAAERRCSLATEMKEAIHGQSKGLREGVRPADRERACPRVEQVASTRASSTWGRSRDPTWDESHVRPEARVRCSFDPRGWKPRRTARSLHVSEERLRAYAVQTGVVEKRHGRLVVIDDDRPREVTTYSGGREETIVLPGYAESAKWGAYMSAVGYFLDTNDPLVLLPFEGDGVTDVNGRFWPFELRPNVLYRLSLTREDPSVLLYRILVAR